MSQKLKLDIGSFPSLEINKFVAVRVSVSKDAHHEEIS